MAFAFIQSNATASPTEPVIIAYSSNVAASSLLVGCAFWNDTGATCSTSDNVNGAWTAVGSPQNGAGALAAWRGQMFYKIGASAGATTVTFDVSTTVDAFGAITEYSCGAGNVPSVDGTPTYASVAANSPTSSAVTTTQAGDLMWYFAVCSGSFPLTANGGYTFRETTDFADDVVMDLLDGGAAGSKTASFTYSGGGSNQTIVGFMAFKETATAGPVIAWTVA